MRPTELALLAAFVLATILAAIAGSQASRADHRFEFRSSTNVSAPVGAKGLALALERLGVPVERRRRPWFDLPDQAGSVDPAALLALIDLTVEPSEVEKGALARYVAAGGSLFIGAISLVEGCFGIAFQSRDSLVHADSAAVLVPEWIGPLPSPVRAFALGADTPPGGDESSAGELLSIASKERSPYSDESWARAAQSQPEACRLQAARADTLLTTTVGEPLALRLHFDGGGRVTLLSDSQYLTNEVLKVSDAGAVTLPLLLADRPRLIIFDEYHHGFRRGRSIWTAAFSWMTRSPAGWLLLQLMAVGLAALGVAAARFGPALTVVERGRRSAIEHLDALAVGLERARGSATAVALIVEGLRRRLGHTAALRRPSDVDLQNWLGALALATSRPEAREDIARLRRLLGAAESDEDVLSAALTVERLWNTLGK